MARASAEDRLRHISEAIRRLERMTAGKSFDDYLADFVLHDAVERTSSAFPRRPGTYPSR